MRVLGCFYAEWNRGVFIVRSLLYYHTSTVLMWLYLIIIYVMSCWLGSGLIVMASLTLHLAWLVLCISFFICSSSVNCIGIS